MGTAGTPNMDPLGTPVAPALQVNDVPFTPQQVYEGAQFMREAYEIMPRLTEDGLIGLLKAPELFEHAQALFCFLLGSMDPRSQDRMAVRVFLSAFCVKFFPNRLFERPTKEASTAFVGATEHMLCSLFGGVVPEMLLGDPFALTPEATRFPSFVAAYAEFDQAYRHVCVCVFFSVCLPS
jgi:hypothetical protein